MYDDPVHPSREKRCISASKQSMYRVTHPYWNSQMGNTQTYITLWFKPCDSTEEAGQLYFICFCLSFELYFLLLGWFCFLKTVKEIKADSKFIQCWYCLANNCKYVKEKEFKKDLLSVGKQWKYLDPRWVTYICLS